LKAGITLYTVLLTVGTILLWVVPMYISADLNYLGYIVACALLGILLSTWVAQLCSYVASERKIAGLDEVRDLRWDIRYAVAVTAVAILSLCGILLDNFYLAYMPLIGLLLLIPLHRRSIRCSYLWMRETIYLIGTVALTSMVMAAAPAILALATALLLRENRRVVLLSLTFLLVYTVFLCYTLYRAWTLGIPPFDILAPTMMFRAATAQIVGQGITPQDVITVLVEAMGIFVSNCIIAGFEELLGRVPILVAGPLIPTLMFITLHIPTRVAAFLSPDFLSIVQLPEVGTVLATSVIAIIALAAVFLIRAYIYAGYFGALLTHAMYNTYLTLYVVEPIAALALISGLALVYTFLRWRELAKEGATLEELILS